MQEKGKTMLMTRSNRTVKRLIEDFMTIEEAMQRTGYKEQYLRRMARRGKVRAVKRGHFWLIERASLQAYLEAAQRSDDKRFGPREVEE
jgi:excisionase family DNA binding protein